MNDDFKLYEVNGTRDVAAAAPSNTLVQSNGVRRDRPKRVLITAACEECRARKAKCNGDRPQCSRCSRVNKLCVYSVSPGETRQAAAKYRVENLQKGYDSVFGIIDSLRSIPLSDARGLLDRLRASQDAASFLEHFRANATSPSLQSPSTAWSQGLSEAAMNETPYSEASWRSRGTSSASSDRLLTPQSPQSSIVPDGLVLPPEAQFREAICSFYESSGKLFHCFDRQSIETLLDQHFGNDMQTISKKDLCKLCCAAGVGVLYMPKPCEPENNMYLIARALLEDVTQESPIEAAKCCLLLGLFNTMSKSTIAFAFIELGMDLARRTFSDTDEDIGLSREEQIDGKKTWRSLLFLGCWISSTLGYVPTNDWMFTELPYDEIEIDGAADFTNVIQTELVKVAVLKKMISCLPEKYSPQSLQNIRGILHKWHRDLPPLMRLNNLVNNPDSMNQTRVSTYIVHLMYLSSSMLFYRQLLNLPPEKSRGFLDTAYHDAITSARQSSRILGLFREDGGVVQRCWLSIYQPYCTSMLLLHGIAQGLLQQENVESQLYTDDLDQARRCIEILQFCGELDRIPAHLFATLKPYYVGLEAAILSRSVSNPKLKLLSVELLDLVRQPFSYRDAQSLEESLRFSNRDTGSSEEAEASGARA